jgi:hypothetical protein
MDRCLPTTTSGKDVILFSVVGNGPREGLLTDPEQAELVHAVEHCWSKTRTPTSAGLMQMDLRAIAPDGTIGLGTDNWASATVFDGNFFGGINSEVANAFGNCFRPWVETRRDAGLTTLRADFRLLPPRQP